MKRTKTEKTHAIIYTRTASVSATHKDIDQIAACTAYTQEKGYEVVGNFNDDGWSGNDENRPGLRELLSCLGKNVADDIRIVMSDPARPARSFGVYLRVQNAITEAGGKIEYVTSTQEKEEAA